MPSEQRYAVTVTRLMCGGRIYAKGDVLTFRSVQGQLHALIRSGALQPLPETAVVELAAGEQLDADEAEPARQVFVYFLESSA